MQIFPSRDHTGTPIGRDGFFHFTSSTMDASALRITAHSRASVVLRQSPGALMMTSMARDAAGSWPGLLVRGVILGSLPPTAGLAHRIRRVDHRGSISLPSFERSRSVHAARLKQHGRRFPLRIFEMLRRARRIWPDGADRQVHWLDERHQDLIHDLGEQLIGRR
jgi:hypothetical protein